jgi:DNA-binding response OmpR family regulator
VTGQPHILVVEDDRVINDAVTRRLRGEGYTVTAVFDGHAAVAAAAEHGFDAIVLDLMLPGLNGIEVCRAVQRRAPVPVLMLTARADEADRIAGLDAGADDYLVKPFSPRELVARVAALLRRVERAASLYAQRRDGAMRVELKGLRVDGAARTATVDGAAVPLTRTEFDLLLALALNAGRVVTRDRLLADVWGWETPTAAAGRTVDSHVKALRRKVGAERIRTVHGVGYAMDGTP